HHPDHRQQHPHDREEEGLLSPDRREPQGRSRRAAGGRVRQPRRGAAGKLVVRKRRRAICRRQALTAGNRIGRIRLMIIAHYAHRLPADYDIQIIRSRAAARGHLFDAIPELYFKAFLLRERGRFGAIANEYSSLYLWRADKGFRDFLVDGRTKSVTDSFGRPRIETRFALEALKGDGKEARFLFRQDQDIPPDADRWKFSRILLSEKEPTGGEQGMVYQVLYLAKPLLKELPKVAREPELAS